MTKDESPREGYDYGGGGGGTVLTLLVVLLIVVAVWVVAEVAA
jgi:hypothetical protein